MRKYKENKFHNKYGKKDDPIHVPDIQYEKVACHKCNNYVHLYVDANLEGRQHFNCVWCDHMYTRYVEGGVVSLCPNTGQWLPLTTGITTMELNIDWSAGATVGAIREYPPVQLINPYVYDEDDIFI